MATCWSLAWGGVTMRSIAFRPGAIHMWIFLCPQQARICGTLVKVKTVRFGITTKTDHLLVTGLYFEAKYHCSYCNESLHPKQNDSESVTPHNTNTTTTTPLTPQHPQLNTTAHLLQHEKTPPKQPNTPFPLPRFFNTPLQHTYTPKYQDFHPNTTIPPNYPNSP